LQRLDEEDGVYLAGLLSDALQPIAPDVPKAALASFSQLIMTLIAATVRHAITREAKEAGRILALFKRMLPKNLAALEIQGSGRDLLLEHRRTGRAQARLLPAQACGNRPGIRNLAGAQAVDVGRAGPALVGSALLGIGRADRHQCEQEAECRSPAATTEKCRTSCKPCLHDRVSQDDAHLDEAGSSSRLRELNFAKCDFSHTSAAVRGDSVRAGNSIL
jgi:hypothetical protein